mmetsp:Transcript_19096/g.24657  ORF Transcript_19096/g.24657 Transcript_19096/m.24657 type:complete len:238 (+) Transcript_19096:183-896(+)
MDSSAAWVKFTGIAVTIGLLSSYVLIRGTFESSLVASNKFASHLEQYGYLGTSAKKILTQEKSKYGRLQEKLREVKEKSSNGALTSKSFESESNYAQNLEFIVTESPKISYDLVTASPNKILREGFDEHKHSKHPLVHKTNHLNSHAELKNYLRLHHSDQIINDDAKPVRQQIDVTRNIFVSLFVLVTVSLSSLLLCGSYKLRRRLYNLRSMRTMHCISDKASHQVMEACRSNPSFI